jgi:hypothetical protein
MKNNESIESYDRDEKREEDQEGHGYEELFFKSKYILFNRYRAFRRARDMRCTLYVICCWMCTLGQVDAILGVSWEDFVATWVYRVPWGYLRYCRVQICPCRRRQYKSKQKWLGIM